MAVGRCRNPLDRSFDVDHVLCWFSTPAIDDIVETPLVGDSGQFQGLSCQQAKPGLWRPPGQYLVDW